jgi:hypothetical protein
MSDVTGWQWTDARELCVEGKAWTDTKEPFDRFPAKAEGKVRDVVWQLSRHATGITVRFEADATEIRARWVLANSQMNFPHTAQFACCGLDLYAATSRGPWRWVGVSRDIKGQESEATLTNWGALAAGSHQFQIYLPIFNPVLKLEIGVPAGACLRTVPRRTEKPVAYYGTSIAHGAGVSRPGMTHVSMLGRRLDYPIWNLGLSGNACMEPEVAELLAELDPACYVLDAVPNMTAAMIEANAESFILKLVAARPGTPMVLVEDRSYPAAWITPGANDMNLSRRAAFRRVYGRLLAAGVGPLHYVEGDGLLGLDGDGTNDGSHPNDLGASRMAEALEPVLRAMLTGLAH